MAMASPTSSSALLGEPLCSRELCGVRQRHRGLVPALISRPSTVPTAFASRLSISFTRSLVSQSPAAGDVNGDGFGDLIIGAPAIPMVPAQSYVVFGRASGFGPSFDLASSGRHQRLSPRRASIRTTSAVPRSPRPGTSTATASAIIIIGAPYAADYAGESYVVFGKASGFDAKPRPREPLTAPTAFASTASLVDPLIWGSQRCLRRRGRRRQRRRLRRYDHRRSPCGDDAGESYVVFGRASGFGASLDLATLDGTNGFRLEWCGDRRLRRGGRGRQRRWLRRSHHRRSGEEAMLYSAEPSGSVPASTSRPLTAPTASASTDRRRTVASARGRQRRRLRRSHHRRSRC